MTVWLPIIILAVGIIFIVLEIFLPSMGLFTIVAAVSIVGSIVLAFRYHTTMGIVFLLGTIFIVPAILFIGFKIFPRTPLGQRMILARPAKKKGEPQAFMTSLKDLEGMVGVTTCNLRPSGIADFGGRRVDVLTEGETIPPKTRVKVIRIAGNRVFVKEAK